MKLKIDAAGNAVLQDGKPVYVADDGKELAFDAPQMYGKITSLTKENGDMRKRADDAEALLATFKGIDDPAAALKAIGIVKNLDDKKLVDAGEIERVKGEVAKGYEGRLTEANAKLKKLEESFFDEVIGGAFARSKFISEKVAIPSDLMQARFASQFGIDNGKPYAVDANGQKIYSKVRLGDLADFDEAIGIIVEGYAQKDHILKGSNAAGGGALNGNNGGGGGTRTVTRSKWETMTPADQAKAGKDYTLVDG